MAITAAAGYPQYSQSLIDPLFYPTLLQRSYAETILKDITSTSYTGQLKNFGDQITFKREPIMNVHRYQKNIKLLTDTPEVETTTLVVDEGFYWNYKMDDVDLFEIQSVNAFKQSLTNSGMRTVAYNVEKSVLAKLVVDAAAYNKGSNAGAVSRNINLGAVGVPLAVTGANFIEVLARAEMVLRESNIWEDGKMFVTLPPAAGSALMTSPLAQFIMTGEKVSGLQGGTEQIYKYSPGGFNLTRSSFCPSVYDQTANAQCHYLIFGKVIATGFVQQISKTDIIKSERFFGEYYRGLQIFGSKVLFPEQLAIAYVRFS
jgi:hypothetical protein